LNDPRRVDLDRLISSLLEILSAGAPLPRHFDRLVTDCGVPRGQASIALLTGLKRVLAKLSEQAFADRETRLATLDAVQGLLDAEIEAEEQEFEDFETGTQADGLG
jgi:type III secretion system TyeA family effector delivery regulator